MKARIVGLLLSVVAITCLLALGAEPVQAAAKTTTIRLASPFKTGHILCDAGQKFKEAVEKGSGGRIEVQVQPGAGSEEEINDWCSKGKVEMQATGGRPLEVSAPQYFFFNAPYVMKDFDHFMRVWKGPLGDKARKQVETKGNQVYLGIVYRGLRQMTSKVPIYTPADVQKMKLRLPTVKTWIAVWKAEGVEPVPIPLPNLYASLKEGKADASEGDLTQISSFKLNEVQKYLTITNHLVQTGGMLINKSFFSKLPAKDRQLILKAAKEATQWGSDQILKGENALYVDLQRKGMQVVIPDTESFRQAAKPAVEELFKTEWPVTTWAEVLAQ